MDDFILHSRNKECTYWIIEAASFDFQETILNIELELFGCFSLTTRQNYPFNKLSPNLQMQ